MKEFVAPNETHEHRLKRLRMRSWRRGMREMDLLLGPYADAHLEGLPGESLDLYERMLGENDQELYLWVSGARDHPAQFSEIIDRIAAFHRIR